MAPLNIIRIESEWSGFLETYICLFHGQGEALSREAGDFIPIHLLASSRHDASLYNAPTEPLNLVSRNTTQQTPQPYPPPRQIPRRTRPTTTISITVTITVLSALISTLRIPVSRPTSSDRHAQPLAQHHGYPRAKTSKTHSATPAAGSIEAGVAG